MTMALVAPPLTLEVMLPGQVPIVGAWVSFTVTLNEQLAVPATFVAVHVTTLNPSGNVWGEVMTVELVLHSTTGVGTPVALGVKDTLAEQEPVSLLLVMSPGQVICGATFPTATVTLKLQLFVLPFVSNARHVTLVVPNANEDPDGGRQVSVGFAVQLSVAVGVV